MIWHWEIFMQLEYITEHWNYIDWHKMLISNICLKSNKIDKKSD